MNKELIEELIKNHLKPEFRGRLIDRGLSRSMIWDNGILPENSSDFSDELTYDLLSYGYSLLSLAIKSIDNDVNETLKNQAFEKAATALMTVIYNGSTNYSKYSFHTLMCAGAYHLAHFSAKSYSLLNRVEEHLSNNILEKSLSLLLTRDFDRLLDIIPVWKFDLKNDLDSLVNKDIHNELDETSVHLTYLNSVLVNRYLEVIYEYLDLLKVGNSSRLESINKILNENISISLKYNFIEDWWIYRITLYLLNDLWDRTYHNILPIEKNNPEWNGYRTKFIEHLMNKDNAEIDLWPSQIEGANRAIYDLENLVISLPTSAGKTRIAELCILRALSKKKKVIFITPLRALSIQTEITLMNTFTYLGNTVSSLYGGMSLYGYQREQFSDSDILIGTPEKLDFLIKHDPELLNDVGLIIMDEGHMIGPAEREVKFEVLIQCLLNREDSDSRRIVCLSAILPSGQELDNFVSWISYDRQGQAITSSWRPTDLRFGIIYPNNSDTGFRLDYVIGAQKPFIPNFIPKIVNNRSKYPNSQQELCLSIAEKFVHDGQNVLIYCPMQKSVNALAKKLVQMTRSRKLDFKNLNIDSEYFHNAVRVADELFGSNHYIVECLKLGIVVHHGKLPKEYRTALELLIKNCKVGLIISSPTLAQGLNLQVNVVLFQSIYRMRDTIPQTEFKNVIGRAGRSFVDLQGIVLYANYDNSSYKAQTWEKLTKGEEQLPLVSGLKDIVLNLLITLIKSQTDKDIEKIYEHIVNSSFKFDFSLDNSKNQLSEKELEKWSERLNLLDYSIINLVGDKDFDILELAEQIDIALQHSLFYKQIQEYSTDEQLMFKKFVQKRAEYLWNKTTESTRKQLYLSGVSFDTIENHDPIIEEIFEIIKNIESILTGSNIDKDKIILNINELADKLFSINEFSPNDLPEKHADILTNWLSGKKYLMNDDIDKIVGFIENDVSYKLVWALEFLKSRHNICAKTEIEVETFDYISQALEYGLIDKCAMTLMQLGIGSRLQVQELTDYLDFIDPKHVIKWLSELNLDDIQNQFSTGLINSLRKLRTKINPFDKKKIITTLTEEPVIWLIDDPESYMFSNLKLININLETFILSNKAEAIGKLKEFIELSSMKILHIYIEDSTVDIKYEYFE